MKADERYERMDELNAVINKASEELKKLDPRRGFLDSIQESLDKFDAEKAAGENWDDKASDLCELLVMGLNSIQSAFEGHVMAHNGEVNLSTAAGSISYDPDAEEWHFTADRP